MDGELRVQVRCKNHGVDQESAWRRAVGADFHFDDRAAFSDSGGGQNFCQLPDEWGTVLEDT